MSEPTSSVSSTQDEPADASGAQPGAWRIFATITATTALVGLPLGVLWRLLAPTIQFEVRDGGLYGAAGNPLDWFGRDGWFIVCGAVLGLGVGWWVHRRWRERPILALTGLTVGGVLAGWLGLVVGQFLGPAAIPSDVKDVAQGTMFSAQLDLLAPASLLAVAFGAVFAYGLASALERDRHRQFDEPDASIS